MLKSKGNVWRASRRGGHVIYIPADIIKDSAYPFEPREEIDVELDPKNKRLIITKREKAKKR